MAYRKIHQRFWRDEKVRQLSMEEKAVALYAMTAQSNRVGLFCFSPALAAEDLDTLPHTFAERFAKVCETLNWSFDAGQKVLWIPRWWRYNFPENGNILTGNLKDLADVPDTPLFLLFANNLEDLAEDEKDFRDTFTNTLAKRYPKRMGIPSPIQKQKQEQKQKQKQEQAGLGEAPACPEPPALTEGPARLPEWLLKKCLALGLAEKQAQELERSHGARSLQAAMVRMEKLVVERGSHLKRPGGMFLTKTLELAKEGETYLQELLRRALVGAPGALVQPQWLQLPLELREDPEVQTAWAALLSARAKSGDPVERASLERAMAMNLQALVSARCPDPAIRGKPDALRRLGLTEEPSLRRASGD